MNNQADVAWPLQVFIRAALRHVKSWIPPGAPRQLPGIVARPPLARRGAEWASRSGDAPLRTASPALANAWDCLCDICKIQVLMISIITDLCEAVADIAHDVLQLCYVLLTSSRTSWCAKSIGITKIVQNHSDVLMSNIYENVIKLTSIVLVYFIS